MLRLFQVIATNHYGTKVDNGHVETYIHGKLIIAPAREHINSDKKKPIPNADLIVISQRDLKSNRCK